MSARFGPIGFPDLKMALRSPRLKLRQLRHDGRTYQLLELEGRSQIRLSLMTDLPLTPLPPSILISLFYSLTC